MLFLPVTSYGEKAGAADARLLEGVRASEPNADRQHLNVETTMRVVDASTSPGAPYSPAIRRREERRERSNWSGFTILQDQRKAKQGNPHLLLAVPAESPAHRESALKSQLMPWTVSHTLLSLCEHHDRLQGCGSMNEIYVRTLAVTSMFVAVLDVSASTLTCARVHALRCSKTRSKPSGSTTSVPPGVLLFARASSKASPADHKGRDQIAFFSRCLSCLR